jgi:hypothetical protein
MSLFIATATVDGCKYLLSMISQDIPEKDQAASVHIMSMPNWVGVAVLYISFLLLYRCLYSRGISKVNAFALSPMPSHNQQAIYVRWVCVLV